jgi:hypothetical protein
LYSPKRAGAALTAGYPLPPGKNVENEVDSSSLPGKQQKDNAAENVPDRKNRKIVPGRKSRKRDGAAKTVGFFLLLKKNAVNSGAISSLLANKQKNTVKRNVLNPCPKKAGAAKTVGFSLLLKKNAVNSGAISSLPANKQKNTVKKNVPIRKTIPGRKSRKIVHDRKKSKKDGAVRMVRFFLLIC